MDWETFFSEKKGESGLTISRQDNKETVIEVCSGCARLYVSPLRDLTAEKQIAATEYLGGSVSNNILTGNLNVFDCDDEQLKNKFLEAFWKGFRERNRCD